MEQKRKTSHDFDFKSELYDKWRKRLYKTYLLIAAIISVTEFVIFFFDDMAGLLYLPIPLYLLIYWIIPSVFNFSVLLATKNFIYAKKYSERTKNIVCTMQLFALCGCSAMIHYIFAPIMCAPCIAIFITVLFADKKLTRHVFTMSLALLAVITVEAYFGLRHDDPQLFLDVAVAAVLAVSVFLSAMLLTNFSREQIDYMQINHDRQIALMDEMRIEPLTGLFNRLAQSEIIEAKINKYSTVTGSYATIAMLDIDFFKSINDTYGHICGDEVIIYLSSLLRRDSNDDYMAFRFGGEEFVVLLGSKTVEQAEEILGAICQEFSKHKFSFSDKKRVTLSGGIAPYCGERSEDEWIEKADMALYRAKNTGRNKLVTYDKKIDSGRNMMHF